MAEEVVGNASAPDAPRPCWIWPFRHGHDTAAGIWRLAGITAGWREGWRWGIAVAGAGLLPLLLCYNLGIGGQQYLTALLLFPLFLGLVRGDRQVCAVLLVGLVFGVHSMLAIGLASADPAGAATLMPDAAEYWEKQVKWIRTGYDPEYELVNWLPAHLQLLGGIVLFSFTSLGFVPFVEGIREVDMMNYYVGRLSASSESGVQAIMVGWHLWSVLRGIAFTLLVYEVVSWSLARLCGRSLSTPSRRRWRWGIGLTFFALDCLVKAATLPTVRQLLSSNLRV